MVLLFTELMTLEVLMRKLCYMFLAYNEDSSAYNFE